MTHAADATSGPPDQMPDSHPHADPPPLDLLARSISGAAALEAIGDRHLAALGLFRMSLQYIVVGLAEWFARFGVEASRTVVRERWEELRAPSDGTLVDLLEVLAIAGDNDGWKGLSAPLWKSVDLTQGTGRRKRRGHKITLSELLATTVSERNDGAEGHGIAGEERPDVLLALCRHLINAFSSVVPIARPETGGLVELRSPDGRAVHVQLVRTSGGMPLCYRNFKDGPEGICTVSAQRQTGPLQRDDVTFQVANPFLRLGTEHADVLYSIADTGNVEWAPLVLLPDRITRTFLGRDDEIRELQAWLADPDSWACQVFGDGGIGKTTLILEFLHRALEHPGTSSDSRPEVISYFTAKQTQWGTDGLVRIRGPRVAIVDVARRIVTAWDGGSLGKEWLSDDADKIVDRLGQYIVNRFGVGRREHLLVLDNTETLADSESEIHDLGRALTRLTRRVGRVLLTSRRREDLEARSVEVLPLSADECCSLLRERGKSLSIQSLEDAGDASLRRYAKQLGRKPLVLEVFVQTLREPGLGMQSAFDRVLRMQRQDLGDFLYSDAWQRLDTQLRHLFLLMTRTVSVLDETLVKLCCLEVDVSVLRAYEALEGSRGIATLQSISGVRQVMFSPDFLRFCDGRSVDPTGALPSNAAVQRVRRRYDEFLNVRSKRIVDRVSHAFRRPFARLAYQAYKDGRQQECEMYYELAVAEDPENALLFDRYAMFLFKQRKLREALGKSVKATQLGPEEAEAWFTRGILESRLSEYGNAIRSLKRAESLGKESYLIRIQLAWACYHAQPRRVQEAERAIVDAEIELPKRDLRAKREIREIRQRLLHPIPTIVRRMK